jgi:hypothetical protein
MREIIGQQGEVRIARISELPADMETTSVERIASGYIISHSESGHHHVLTGGEVMERTDKVPAGMRIFYALLDAPASLVQDAPVPHEGFDLAPGIYQFTISREYDPFAAQARIVAD